MKLNVPEDCYLVAVGRPVEKGEIVEVDDETGVSLVAQGWHESHAKRPADVVADEPIVSPTPVEVQAEEEAVTAEKVEEA